MNCGKKYLIVVDMQNDFIDGALGSEEAKAIVPLVADKMRKLSGEGYLIVRTMDSHGDDYLGTQEGRNLPVPHCIKGTRGWEVCREVDEAARPFASVCKGAFGFSEWANVISRDASEIVLVGLCTDICVISNAMVLKAAFPEAKISVDSSCCAGVTPESHETALKAMAACQIEII